MVVWSVSKDPPEADVYKNDTVADLHVGEPTKDES